MTQTLNRTYGPQWNVFLFAKGSVPWYSHTQEENVFEFERFGKRCLVIKLDIKLNYEPERIANNEIKVVFSSKMPWFSKPVLE